MPVKVKLKFTKGGLKEKEFCYEQKESVIIGRLDDSNLVIPATDTTVSRYHCMLDITPPVVKVRDFGSLNGTFLNGEKIGQRDSFLSVEEARQQNYNEVVMISGDRLRLGGDCEMVLNIAIPKYCADCFCEVDQPKYTNADHQCVCSDCHQKAEEQKKKEEGARLAGDHAAQERRIAEAIRLAMEKDKRKNPKCEICGVSVPAIGPAICSDCKKDPLKLIAFLMKVAKKGDGDAQQIAGYKDIRMLGQGGMGAVWLVEEIKSGEQMAMKLMLQQAAADERARKMFLREAHNACQLVHNNIVRHYKSGHSGDVFFILMEFCAGGSVDHLMKANGGKLSIDTATHIILQVLDGLHYASTVSIESAISGSREKSVEGIVHRDLKPANIFLTDTSSRPVAKIADFGLAKAFQTAGLTTDTVTGDAAGSPWFMPRQQITNYRYAKPEVDVWAAAASYYNMLTGSFPKNFTGKDAFSDALYNDPVPIRNRNARIPEKLARVIDAALKERPEIGVKTALELKKSIEKAL